MNEFNDNDEPHGYWEYRLNTGELLFKGYYDNNIPVKKWEWFNPNNEIFSKMFYL